MLVLHKSINLHWEKPHLNGNSMLVLDKNINFYWENYLLYLFTSSAMLASLILPVVYNYNAVLTKSITAHIYLPNHSLNLDCYHLYSLWQNIEVFFRVTWFFFWSAPLNHSSITSETLGGKRSTRHPGQLWVFVAQHVFFFFLYNMNFRRIC